MRSQPNTDDQPDIHSILQLASCSPSSHNTQPWHVAIDHAGKELIIGYEPARQLLVGDPDKRELYISLGCFVETIARAAQSYGYDTEVTVVNQQPGQVVKITLRPATNQPSLDQQMRDVILKRRSDRRHYKPAALNAEQKAAICATSTDSVYMRLYENTQDIRLLADATYQATLTFMKRPDFRAELAKWVRNNWTRQHDGMPGYTQGIPGPVSLLAPIVIRNHAGVATDQATKDSQRVLHSAAVGLLYVTHNGPSDWLQAGRLYQSACLAAAAAGISSSAVSAAVIDPATTKTIQEQLQIYDVPVALLRFGFVEGQTPKASPRRTTADFTAA